MLLAAMAAMVLVAIAPAALAQNEVTQEVGGAEQ